MPGHLFPRQLIDQPLEIAFARAASDRRNTECRYDGKDPPKGASELTGPIPYHKSGIRVRPLIETCRLVPSDLRRPRPESTRGDAARLTRWASCSMTSSV
jgi:hypothetical protein